MKSFKRACVCVWQWAGGADVASPARGTAGARGNDLPEVGVKSFKERVCVCVALSGTHWHII